MIKQDKITLAIAKAAKRILLGEDNIVDEIQYRCTACGCMDVELIGGEMLCMDCGQDAVKVVDEEDASPGMEKEKEDDSEVKGEEIASDDIPDQGEEKPVAEGVNLLGAQGLDDSRVSRNQARWQSALGLSQVGATMADERQDGSELSAMDPSVRTGNGGTVVKIDGKQAADDLARDAAASIKGRAKMTNESKSSDLADQCEEIASRLAGLIDNRSELSSVDMQRLMIAKDRLKQVLLSVEGE